MYCMKVVARNEDGSATVTCKDAGGYHYEESGTGETNSYHTVQR